MEKKIIVAGHLCVDITPVFPEGKTRSIGELLTPGKLLQMKPATVHTGGVVANTGLALKKMGADVRLIGKLGEDAFGHMVRNILKAHGADGDVLADPQDSTSYTIALAPPGIDRIFLHNPGANDSFCADDVPEEALESAALLHFGYPPIMKRFYENGSEELLKLIRRAHGCGAMVSLDMTAVDEDSEAGKADWEQILKDVLPQVEFFVPSVEELCFMLDCPRYEEWTRRAAGGDVTEILTLEDIRPLAERTMALGARVLLLKCGVPGMYYRTAPAEQMEGYREAGLNLDAWGGKEGFMGSYIPDRVRSGTGAGDTSIAAFLLSMLRGYPLEQCVRLAAAEGASCVEEFDALSGVRTLEELEEKIASGWKQRELS